MQTYPADAHDFQSERQAPADTIFAWFRRKVEAHRMYQASKQHLEYCRTLDRHFLDDMGLDITGLEEMHAKLAGDRLAVVLDAVVEPIQLPVNMSSR
jgi:hypothetical protein